MLRHIGIGIFHNCIIALGISHKEVIAGRVGVHAHIVFFQHFYCLLHRACPVEKHAHGKSGEYFLFARGCLLGGKSVEFQDAHSKSVFVDAVE